MHTVHIEPPWSGPIIWFLLAEQDALLRELVGAPIVVPLTVYDPDERTLPDEALRRSELLSEMRQSIRHYEALGDTETSNLELVERVRRVDDLHDQGLLETVVMDADERSLAAHLQSQDGADDHGLRLPLGPGEAACVAIASTRRWTIVTDDTAALMVMEVRHGADGFEYERIRKLLTRAAHQGLITEDEANEIHDDMRHLGFWDTEGPFPP